MSIEDTSNKKKKLTREHKILAKNSIYSLMHNYGNYIFSIITASLIARTISPQEWQYLILTLSLIGIFMTFLAFLPPSLGGSMIYYISGYHALNYNNKLRSFTRNAIFLRILFLIPFFLLSIFVFRIFLEFFKISLKEYYYLFYLLSPLIIINGLNGILTELTRALNMFKVNFFLLIIHNIIYIGGLLVLFFYIESNIMIYIGVIYIVASVIPFIINCFIIYLKFKFKIKKTEEEGDTFIECAKKVYKYGSFLSIIDGYSTFSINIKPQLIGGYEVAGMVTGYHIATRYNSVSSVTTTPLNRPLSVSLTRLYSKEQFGQIQKIYNSIFKYILVLSLLATGFFFFMTEFFLIIIYGESYLIYSLLVKFSLISIIFNIQDAFLGSFLIASNRVKLLSIIVLVFGALQLTFFAIGLIFYGIIISILFLTCSYIICLISYTLILNKFKIKLKIKKTILLFSIFFISLLSTLILEAFILKSIYLSILRDLNLMIFQYFNPLSFGVFLLLYLILIVLFKVVTVSDIEILESFFIKDSRLHKILRKIFSSSKKFLFS